MRTLRAETELIVLFKNLCRNEKASEFRESLYYYLKTTFMAQAVKKIAKKHPLKASQLKSKALFVLKITPENEE